jgi:hypothetical protein
VLCFGERPTLRSEITPWASGNSGAFTNGDLSSSFPLPDYRGEFLRIYDDGPGVDGGRSINARQSDLLGEALQWRSNGSRKEAL